MLAKMQASLRTVMARKAAAPATAATADFIPADDDTVLVSVGPTYAPLKRDLSSSARFSALSKLGADVSRAFNGMFPLKRTTASATISPA